METPPLIEIACVGLERPARLAAGTFVVEAEAGLRSAGVPPRFQAELDRTAGCLYRLGRRAAESRPAGALSAYELLSPECRERFPPSFLEFATEHRAAVAALLGSIVAASPRGEAVFTSDWQFGPEGAHRVGPVPLAELWRLHDAHLLYLNTAYALVA
jgi:hypothetical protein